MRADQNATQAQQLSAKSDSGHSKYLQEIVSTVLLV